VTEETALRPVHTYPALGCAALSCAALCCASTSRASRNRKMCLLARRSAAQCMCERFHWNTRSY